MRLYLYLQNCSMLFIGTLILSHFLKYHRNLQFKEWIFTLPLLTVSSRYLTMCVLFHLKKCLPGVGVEVGVKNLVLLFGAHFFVWKAERWDSIRAALKDPDEGRLWFQQLTPLSYWLQAATIPPVDLCEKWIRAGWAFSRGATAATPSNYCRSSPPTLLSSPIYSFLCPSLLPPTHFSPGPTEPKGRGFLPWSVSRARRLLVGGECATCVRHGRAGGRLWLSWGPAGPGCDEWAATLVWHGEERGCADLTLVGGWGSHGWGKSVRWFVGKEGAWWALGNGGGRNGCGWTVETGGGSAGVVVLLVWFWDPGLEKWDPKELGMGSERPTKIQRAK